jgi:serine/threonine-protein kinase
MPGGDLHTPRSGVLIDPQGQTFASPSPVSAPGAPAVTSPYVRGDHLDRFVILETLGAGGMSVVLSAYDPGLDRRVAIKLLREEMWRAEGVRGRDRLLREAQAMARLSHPNVVTVHEVFARGDEVFIAMEHVAGRTLRDFIREARQGEPRPWREIVEPFLQAGRGLAAAHHVGLVHRDFKPDNVLIGEDGRVRVTDFGLVSTAGAVEELDAPRDGGDFASHDDLRTPTPIPMSASLTRTGALLGTPAYMAPEQDRLTAVDGRADQFAFCVSLWEALYGDRPFPGSTLTEVIKSISAGRMREPSAEARARVPAWVHAALVRGLAHDPAKRWPSMDELLARLSSDPTGASRERRVRVLLGVVIVALSTVAVVGMVRQPRSAESRCDGASKEIAGVWNIAIRNQIAVRFGQTGRTYANETFTHAARLIDSYAAAWSQMRTEACEATHVYGRQSAASLDLRMRCLDRRRAALRATTELWSTGVTTEVVDRAVDAVASLPTLEACADVESLGVAVPLPDVPTERARAEVLAAELDRLDALAGAGRFQEALPRAQKAAEDARRLAFPPLLARALHGLGTLEHELSSDKVAEATLRHAIHAAAQARDDQRSAEAWMALSIAIAGQGRFEEALAQRTAMEAAAARAGDGDLLRADMWSHLGTMLWGLGRYDEAQELIERALGVREKRLGVDHPDIAESLEALGNVLAEKASYTDARPRLERAVAIREKVQGRRHPRTASARNDLGMLLRDMGEPRRALENFELALSVFEETLGREHADVGRILNNIGLALSDQNKNAEAEPFFRHALAVKEKALGAEHPSTALTLSNLGAVLVELGKGADAGPLLQRALAIYKASQSADHANLALPHHTLGAALRLARKCNEAIPHILEAKKIWEKTIGPGHPQVASAYFDLGVCETDLGRAQAAIPLLEKALAMREKAGKAKGSIAETRWQLGRALWESGRDRANGLALVRDARVKLADLRQAREIDLWLAARKL